ncbi:MAG: ABC transporter permease [Gemmatimonadota bacterium]
MKAGVKAGLRWYVGAGLLLALAIWRRARVAETVSGSDVAGWIALATLVVGVTAFTAVGVRAQRGPSSAIGHSWWEIGLRQFRLHKSAVLGVQILLLLSLATLLTPLLSPFDPNAIDPAASRLLTPSWGHPMGTDHLGRDVLSRVLYGGRISLSIGFLSILIAVTLGVVVGAVAGYLGGWIDGVLMRIVDLFLSFPRLILLVTIVAVFPPSVFLIVAILGLTGWMGVARLVRGQVLSLREREYIQAARALGFRGRRILARHILPNVLTPVIVAATLGIGNAILAEAALSFLGLGVAPPTASWGSVINDGKRFMLDGWWITSFPGLAIVLTVVSFNLVGDGLRDALDPRHSE